MCWSIPTDTLDSYYKFWVFAMKLIPKAMLSILLGSSVILGANAAEPYFSDDFDTGKLGSSSEFSWSGTRTISTEHSYSGQYAMKFTFGPDASGEDSWTEQRFSLSSSASSAPREVWIEYMLRLPENWVHRYQAPANNKLFAIFAENYSNNGDIQAVFEYERESDTRSNIRVICMSGRGCLKGNYLAYLFDGSMRGEWIRLRFHLKAGQNGLIEVWRNNEMVYSIYDYEHYFSSGNNYWRTGYLMGWSNSGYAEKTDFFIDNFKVYKENPGWSFQTDPAGARPNPPVLELQ